MDALRLADDVRAAKYIIATKTFKDVARATDVSFGTRGFLLRAAGPLLIIIGVVFAFLSLIVSTSSTKGVGSNSIVVDPPFTDPIVYDHDAPTSASIQYWSFRNNGPSVTQNFNLNLSKAENYKLGTIVVVKNATVHYNSSTEGVFVAPLFQAVNVNITTNSNNIETTVLNYNNSSKTQSFVTVKPCSACEVVWASNAIPK